MVLFIWLAFTLVGAAGAGCYDSCPDAVGSSGHGGCCPQPQAEPDASGPRLLDENTVAHNDCAPPSADDCPSCRFGKRSSDAHNGLRSRAVSVAPQALIFRPGSRIACAGIGTLAPPPVPSPHLAHLETLILRL